MMLHPPGGGMADWPQPFRYALSDNATIARHVAALCCEHDDRVMWHMLLDDLVHLRILDSCHREFHGGKFQTIPKPSPQGSLFAGSDLGLEVIEGEGVAG